jgi:hypothetical protein
MTDEPKPKHDTIFEPEQDLIPEATKGFFADLDALRKETAAADIAGVGSKEVLIRVPVRRPKRTEFIRTHPDPQMQLAATVYADRDENEDVFFVPKPMRDAFDEGQLRQVRLQLTISRRGTLFIWPIPLVVDGRSMGRSWHESAFKAAELAKGRWLRMAADKGLSGYRVHLAEGEIPEPTWPQYSFGELLEIAFEGHIIQSADHPVIRDLRGCK